MSVQYVKIYYGPYDAFHTISHKPQKLRGLKDRLQKLGYRIDLVPVEYINYCALEMCGHEVFRCNIENLKFNAPVESDPVCARGVAAVVDASAQFSRARSYLWFWALIDSQLFRRSGFAPKDHWPFDVDPEDYDTCLECHTCCGDLNKTEDHLQLDVLNIQLQMISVEREADKESFRIVYKIYTNFSTKLYKYFKINSN